MKPYLEILGLTINSYKLFSILAILAGLMLFTVTLKRIKAETYKILILYPSLLLATYIGARLFNMFLNQKFIPMSNLFNSPFTNLSIFGAFIGALIIIFLWSLIFKIPLFKTLDACVLPGAISFAIAKTGCFLNGCCGGKATTSVIGIVYPHLKNLPWPSNIAIWPTQLFEIFSAVVILILVFITTNKKRKFPDGSSFLLYSSLFCLMRVLILPLRRLPYPEWIIRYFYPAFYISLIILSITILIIRYKKHAKETK